MFKGLRTKIESEQRGQTKNVGRNDRGSPTQAVPTTIKTTAPNSSQTILKPTDPHHLSDDNNGPDTLIPHDLPNANDASLSNSLSSEIRNISTSKDHKSNYGLNKLEQLNLSDLEEDQDNDADILKGRIVKLKDHLKAVMREKLESDDQNAQLYQMIDQLRRSLELEQETNSSLREKINGLENQLKEKTDMNSFEDNSRTNNNFITSNKSFNPDGIPCITTAGPNIPENIDSLRNEIIELQAQLAKKNRQLKIRQQNLNDIKKTLQKEIFDHSRTQDELARLQKQLQNNEQASLTQHLNKDKSASSSQNGSSQVEPCDTIQKNNLNQSIGDMNQEFRQSSHSQVGGVASNLGEDTISLGATMGGGINVQFDRLSCLSRSSASVDDFESNDLQQSNYVKEVSHEYLRNVLFRYMISTEKETTQHLVKAISVLMDFTPEQSAAIKSAMNSRTSWLRLK